MTNIMFLGFFHLGYVNIDISYPLSNGMKTAILFSIKSFGFQLYKLASLDVVCLDRGRNWGGWLTCGWSRTWVRVWRVRDTSRQRAQTGRKEPTEPGGWDKTHQTAALGVKEEKILRVKISVVSEGGTKATFTLFLKTYIFLCVLVNRQTTF